MSEENKVQDNAPEEAKHEAQKAEKKGKKEVVFKSHVLHNGKEFKKGEVCPKELLHVIPDFCLEEK